MFEFYNDAITSINVNDSAYTTILIQHAKTASNKITPYQVSELAND